MVLTHAYSVSNAGDGWLVHLAIDLVREAVEGAEVAVVAVDGTSIDGADHVLTFGGRSRDLRGAARSLLASIGLGRTREVTAIANADLVVAVGGGYLRGRTLRELAVMGLVHGTQLHAAARRSGPSVYLPQSVGPLPGAVARLVRSDLRRISVVHGRDEPTMAFLAPLPNVVRTPDLAALAVAGAGPRGVAAVGAGGRPIPVLFQVRPLPNHPAWEPALTAFASTIDLDLIPAVQSVAGRRNDDLALTARLARTAAVPSVAEVLATGPDLTVALCGRLHAALACIEAGVPAIHVGYERKSLGVFSDLGLERYVVAPSAPGLEEAEALVRQLAEDATPYWSSLAARAPGLRHHRADLVAELRRVASGT